MTSRDYDTYSYADCGAHFGILREILKDRSLTSSYRSAIMNNTDLFKGKAVLDVGCGPGILSMFAAKAGATHVVGIDLSNIIDQTQTIIEANGFKDTITLVKGKLEEVELPIKEFDIIISDWMGYFLLYGSTLDTVLVARDKYLKKGGLIFPDQATVFLAAIEDQEYKEEKFDFWDNFDGFDLSCIKEIALREPVVDTVELKSLVTNPCLIKEFNLYTVTKEELTFDVPFSLDCARDDFVHAFIAWFDVSFTGSTKPVRLSTGPYTRYTHWKQTIFYIPNAMTVQKGDKIEGRLACAPNARNKGDLDITIQYKDANGQGDSVKYKMFN